MKVIGGLCLTHRKRSPGDPVTPGVGRGLRVTPLLSVGRDLLNVGALPPSLLHECVICPVSHLFPKPRLRVTLQGQCTALPHLSPLKTLPSLYMSNPPGFKGYIRITVQPKTSPASSLTLCVSTSFSNMPFYRLSHFVHFSMQ